MRSTSSEYKVIEEPRISNQSKYHWKDATVCVHSVFILFPECSTSSPYERTQPMSSSHTYMLHSKGLMPDFERDATGLRTKFADQLPSDVQGSLPVSSAAACVHFLSVSNKS